MEELIGKLGIDWKLLLAQAVNFAILVFVLAKFAYKPILKVLDERSAKAKKSLEDAQRIEDNLKAAEQLKAENIVAGRKEAKRIVEAAAAEGDQVKLAKLEETKAEVERLIVEAKRTIERDRQASLEQASREIGSLVSLATSQVLKKKLDPKTDEELIRDVLKGLQKKS